MRGKELYRRAVLLRETTARALAQLAGAIMV
ncbi:hypothetical protein BH23ACT8_BH23ACT8_22990 [soil metagenome]